MSIGFINKLLGRQQGPRVIVSGNNSYGLAQDIEKVFPQAKFCSRSTSGHDFSKHEDQMAFAELTLDYDIYISCSCLNQFRQVLLLEKVYSLWQSKGKAGHILCIGSSLDRKVGGTEWRYPIEKRALREYCANLSLAIKGDKRSRTSAIKITYLSPGYITTPKIEEKYPGTDKISTLYIANLLKWIVDQPAEYNIGEISLTPIPFDKDQS